MIIYLQSSGIYGELVTTEWDVWLFDVYLVCCLRASDTEELPPGLCSSSQFWGVCLALVYLRKGQFIIYGRGQGVCQTGLAQKCPQAACPKNICFRSVPSPHWLVATPSTRKLYYKRSLISNLSRSVWDWIFVITKYLQYNNYSRHPVYRRSKLN